jgi:hypothetical protein
LRHMLVDCFQLSILARHHMRCIPMIPRPTVILLIRPGALSTASLADSIRVTEDRFSI